jgi:hypothetical protein
MVSKSTERRFALDKDLAMNHSKLMHLLLLSVTAMGFMGVTSCAPSKPPTIAAKEEPLRSKRVLTKEEIIAAADAVVQQCVMSNKGYEISLDEGNATWKTAARWRLLPYSRGGRHEASTAKADEDELNAKIVERWPMLAGRDYQVVSCSGKPVICHFGDVQIALGDIDGGLTVLVDRNTGKVLLAIDAWDNVIGPADVGIIRFLRG